MNPSPTGGRKVSGNICRGRRARHPAGVSGWLSVEGWPRKARQSPSGLAGSASSPLRGAPFARAKPARKPPHQGRWPRSRPEGFSPLTGSIAKPRAGHARPLRTAVNRCAREGQGRAVARERVLTHSPSKPLRPRLRSASSPKRGAFLRGRSPRESLPCQREVPSASEAEGFPDVCGCNGQSGTARRNPPVR